MRRFTLLLVLMAMLVAACGGADNPTTTSAPATTTTTAPTTTTTEAVVEDFPVTIQADNGSVAIDARPERIVSLSATATEMLFAIGAGLQVVAVDSFSYYPADAPVTDLSGFTPDLEAVLAFEPDLVVAQIDPGNTLADGLGILGIPLIIFDTASTIDDVYTQIRTLGAATGNLELADKVADEIEADLDEVVAGAAGTGEGVTYLHDVGFGYAASSSSFTGQIYNLFGMVNIADAAPGAEFGFPELSSEYVVDADPEMIFSSFDSPADVGARPGWEGITAVVNGAVVLLDMDTSSRWGPRIVDFARDVAAALEEHVGS